MQKIIINRLGPIKYCKLNIDSFTVFTGPQASGKSTVAKSVFFFKNIKNILFTQFRKQCFFNDIPTDEAVKLSLRNRLQREIRSNFLQIFGTTWHMDLSMNLFYEYREGTFIKVSLKSDSVSPNYIWLDFSDDLNNFLNSLEKLIQKNAGTISQDELSEVKERINQFFDDNAEIVYIPAGRSMITLLSTQLNYIYSSMDDIQKKNLDYCTQNYLERILQLKPAFSHSIAQMVQNTIRLTDTKIDRELLLSAAELIRKILQGEYRNVDGEERLQVSENRYVKINFASSGQQEAVWILNVIFYYLLNNRKTYFIIEEPESHLFPNAQKLMAEFIAIARNKNRNHMFITTHSPYILGTINNLLYAGKISAVVDQTDLEKIVSEDKWIAFADMSAYFVDHGQVFSCTDDEFEAIENEIIDGASENINRDYDEMVLLKERYLQKGG